MLDIPSLLQPVTATSPAGANLDSRADFLEFERALVGKPERQSGATIVPAEPPDWSFIARRSVELLAESRDLRVAVQFARAALHTRAFAGMAEGLSLVRQLLDTFWDSLHPELDHEENDAPTQRITAMMALVHRDMTQALRAAPLVKAPGLGTVCLRDLDSPAGRGDGAGALEAVFRAASAEDFSAALAAVEASDKEAGQLAETWAKRAGASATALDFRDLRKVLAQASTVMREHQARREPAATGEAPSVDGQGAPAAGGQLRGEVRTREDVVTALERICAYYARHEPSSPVPILLERCKRLAAMSFLEIVMDMMPDGLSTIQTIAGKQDAET